jgi:hypothetical protein
VRSHGEFFFELRADEESGVIDMLAGPTEDEYGCDHRCGCQRRHCGSHGLSRAGCDPNGRALVRTAR